MLEKNPYENGVDIPDFVETKEDDIDMSVFKMSEDELKSNTSSLDFAAEDEYDYDDDEEDDEPKRKLSAKGVVLVGGLLIAVLLITTIIGFVFGFSQKGKVKELQAQVETVNAQLVEANNKVTALQNEITAMKAAAEAEKEPQPQTGGSSYKIVSSSGIRVRNAAGATGNSYAKEADCKVLKDVNINEGVIMLSSGADVNVYETVEVSGATWGRIVDGKDVWICLKMADGSVLAKAQ